ncbi:MAG: histidine kinase [Bacteroidales bacterium]|nr:histidine kinase [Bacteroidales bacterium]
MKKVKFSRLLEGKLGEFFLWFMILVMLTANNARFSIKVSIILAFVSLGGMLSISILNRAILIPRLLDKNRNQFFYFASFVSIVILSFLFSIIDLQIVRQLIPMQPLPKMTLPPPPEGFNLIPFFRIGFLIVGSFLVTMMLYMAAKAKVHENRTQELQNEKSGMELKFLKSQINPHFLFNALNNIYSMIYTGDKKAASSVLKLSDLLRYVTDDCQSETISVEKEVLYIENYIDFQQIRMENRMNVTFEKNIANSRQMIPPMLLQPFVENCFKHSRIENNSHAYISIALKVDNHQLIFIVENSKPDQKIKTTDIKRNGIGIENVKKRLSLLFPEKHSIETIDKSDKFTVILKLEID